LVRVQGWPKYSVLEPDSLSHTCLTRNRYKPSMLENLTAVNIYTDESSTRNCRYFLIGGLWIERAMEPTIRMALRSFRSSHLMGRELKWAKVSNAKLNSYKELVSLASRNAYLRFRCIVVDTHRVDVAKYSNSDPELSFFKFYYLLLSRNMSPNETCFITTDQLLTRKSDRLVDLQNSCNNWFLKANPGLSSPPISNLQPVDSKKEDLVQLTDVLLGAVASTFNQNVTSTAKLALANHLCQCYGVADLTQGCRKPKINIWVWEPRK
jgi:hypothetical protein